MWGLGPEVIQSLQAFTRLALVIAIFPHDSFSASTLQEQLNQAVEAFTNGQYNEAYWAFESIVLDYGQEPEFLDTDFQRTILPIHAYSALMADRPTDALVHFNTLLTEHKISPDVSAFTLYNSAVAAAQTGALARAAQAYRSFRRSFAGSTEAHLALLQEADLLGAIGALEEANGLLDDFYESDAPLSLRMQGRLRALQLASDANHAPRVYHILLNTDWQVDDMPDIAVLSFAALDAGDRLLAEKQYDAAIRAYRLSFPRDILIEKQRERLLSVQRSVRRSAAFASSIWKTYSAQLIARLERQLERLESMVDYTAGLFLRSGQAYLLGTRYPEAAILFRTIAEDSAYEQAIRAQAHYRWILALSEAGKWQAARDTADRFIVLHPGHALANRARFLIASAYQGEGRLAEAIEILDALIDHFPDDRQAPRWYYTRGYLYSVLEQQETARTDFQTALERFPQSELATQLEMWVGLSFFFERNYETARRHLETLAEKSAKHPLYPEIKYRMAHVRYAMRDYGAALDTAETLITDYPDHYRYAETLALKGDIHMGLGALATAARAFKQVPPEDTPVYDYAIFQAAKIYRALQRHDLLQEHLAAYLTREDGNKRPRMSEALYWIAWSLQQEERIEEAFALYEDALERFGNDTKACAIGSILSEYADLYKIRKAGESFETWLQENTESSLRAGELTWFARLTQFTAQRLRSSMDDQAADAALLSIHRLVPVNQQDADTLAAVGIILAERGYDSADDYFECILNVFPKRFERAAAYYGKALLAKRSNHLEQSRRWLVRFLEETPTHPLAADARLLAAEVLTQQGLFEAATESLNEILQLKKMRGRPHARALAALARIEAELENPKRSIPYWQRIYTLYRAYPDLVAEAYWESARLFEQIDDPIAAHNTVVEMLRDERLKKFSQFALAEAKLAVWEAAARERRTQDEQNIEGSETEAVQ